MTTLSVLEDVAATSVRLAPIRSASHAKTNEAVFNIVAAHLKPSSRVLDMGAGQGHMSRRLGQWFTRHGGDPAQHVVACDIVAEGFQAQEVPFQQFDVNRGLPFADATFDCIVTIEVLEHVQNVYAQFEDFKRILKPGGVLVFSVPNTVHMTSRLSFLFNGFFDLYLPPSSEPRNAGRICGHIMPLNFAYYAYGLRRLGFRSIRFHRDKTKNSAAVLATLLWPFTFIANRMYHRKIQRYDAAVYAENPEVINIMTGFAVQTSRSCIVEAVLD